MLYSTDLVPYSYYTVIVHTVPAKEVTRMKQSPLLRERADGATMRTCANRRPFTWRSKRENEEGRKVQFWKRSESIMRSKSLCDHVITHYMSYLYKHDVIVGLQSSCSHWMRPQIGFTERNGGKIFCG